MSPAIHHGLSDLPPADIVYPEPFHSKFRSPLIPDDGRKISACAREIQRTGICKSRPLTKDLDGLIPYIRCHLPQAILGLGIHQQHLGIAYQYQIGAEL